MPLVSPTYAFVSGELSPDVYGRPDLAKYDLGVSLAENFFVNYRGGLMTRAGTEYTGLIKDGTAGYTLQCFRTTTSDLVLVFGDHYMQVVQDGGFVVDKTVSVTGVALSNPVEVSATAHGLTTGDWVTLEEIVGPDELNGRQYEVIVTGANTFTISDVFSGPVDGTGMGAYASGGKAYRRFTFPTPFNGADLEGFTFEQDNESLTIVGKAIVPHQLVINSVTSWSLNPIDFTPDVPKPTNVVLTPSSAGTAGVAFAVTAIIDQKESLPSEYAITRLTVNYTDTAGSMLVKWDAVPNASQYNVYRSLVLPIGADITKAQEVGFVGRAFSPQFTDNNIIPDFTKTPQRYFNPFADGQIIAINVTAGGSGYSDSDTVTVSGGGSGFEGYPIVDSAGAIIAIIVVNGGSGYVSPTVTVTGGTGATFTVKVGEASGNNPSVYRRFQQRGIYAGVSNTPQTIYASVPGQPSNMFISPIVNAGDGYIFTLDSGEPKGIKHLVALRSGLLIMTDEGVTQLRAQEGRAVSGVNALAEQQIYKGVSDVKPLTINNDVLFLQAEGGALNVMVYTAYTQSFELQDITVLSNHLLTSDNRGLRMEYVDDPFRLIHVLREDGALVVCAYERAQDVFGWTHYSTQGKYRDCVAVKEVKRSTMYYGVERKLGGKWVHTLEHEQSRIVPHVEDSFAVDCGIRLWPTEGNVGAEVRRVDDDFNVIFEAPVTLAVGDMLFFLGGKVEVTQIVSPTEVVATMWLPLTEEIMQDDGTDVDGQFYPVAKGEWSYITPQKVLKGLWHLEGKVVNVLADGAAFRNVTVIGGEITLSKPASKVIIGLPYVALGRTLPLTSREMVSIGKRKRVHSIAIRLQDSRGLELGDTLDSMYEIREEGDELNWGEPLTVRNGIEEVAINHGWKRDSMLFFRQRYPLPATILGFVENYTVGDMG